MPQETVKKIVESLDRHKAQNIRILEVSKVTSIADYFIMASGTSSTQVQALADYVEDELAPHGLVPLRKEGYASATWILLDYASVVVHVFREDTRQFYDLERLWKDGREHKLTEFLADRQEDLSEKL